MIMSQETGKKELTRDEAEEIGQRFLSGRYPGAKITFDKATLDIKGASPLYYLEGQIRMPLRSMIFRPFSSLFLPPDQFTFKMKIHATQGKLLSWELE